MATFLAQNLLKKKKKGGGALFTCRIYVWLGIIFLLFFFVTEWNPQSWQQIYIVSALVFIVELQL